MALALAMRVDVITRLTGYRRCGFGPVTLAFCVQNRA